jgi:hypothetical protein
MINKPLATLIKRRNKDSRINKIRDEIEDITTDTREIHKLIREYFENAYSSKLEKSRN